MSENDQELGQSSTAATWAISMVVFSRIGMASPGMVIPPIFMNALEKKGKYYIFSCFVHLVAIHFSIKSTIYDSPKANAHVIKCVYTKDITLLYH